MLLWSAGVAALLLLAFVGLQLYLAVQSSSIGFMLYTYAGQGDLANVQALLRKPYVDPNSRILLDNLRVTTPLRAARENGHRDVEQALIAAGARE